MPLASAGLHTYGAGRFVRAVSRTAELLPRLTRHHSRELVSAPAAGPHASCAFHTRCPAWLSRAVPSAVRSRLCPEVPEALAGGGSVPVATGKTLCSSRRAQARLPQHEPPLPAWLSCPVSLCSGKKTTAVFSRVSQSSEPDSWHQAAFDVNLQLITCSC